MDNVFTNRELADFREIPIDNFAYIGDAIIALKYKLLLLNDGRKKTRLITKQSIDFLSAKAHGKFVDLLIDKLTDEELNVYKRGYNSKGAKKRGNDEDYRKSTGLEALIGYLYLGKNYNRLEEIFEVINSCMFLGEMY